MRTVMNWKNPGPDKVMILLKKYNSNTIRQMSGRERVLELNGNWGDIILCERNRKVQLGVKLLANNISFSFIEVPS